MPRRTYETNTFVSTLSSHSVLWFFFQGKAKWDAWNSKKGMEQGKAKDEYVVFAKKMMDKHGSR